MLGRLRAKFILTNMLLVTAVLSFVFGVLLFSNARQLTEESLLAMTRALRWDSQEGPPPFQFFGTPLRPGAQSQSIVPVFCVTLDENGQITDLVSSSDNASVAIDLAQEAVTLALESGSRAGLLSQLSLRFLLDDSQDPVTHIAFCDRSWEWHTLSRLTLSSLAVMLGALALFFLISIFLARLALRPVEQAWQQQRQFVADASHELKTPLTVILANTSIVLSHPDSSVEGQRKWIQHIQDEAVRMKSLVENMLFLARHDAAKAPPKRSLLNFSDLVTESLLLFESVAFEQGIQLTGEVTPNLSLLGDRDTLRQLLGILLDNGVKYAGEGGAVELRLERRQDKLLLTVHNTGQPIPPDRLPHIFERFYRVDTARARSEGGYGLGLAIAQSIVETHHGHISATSTPQDGTTFTVSLPGRSEA